MRHPLYCQLWEAHTDFACDQGFRALQGHFMFAFIALARKLHSADWWEIESHARVAGHHVYKASLPLKHIARMPIEGDKGELYKKLLTSISRTSCRKKLSEYLCDFRISISTDKELSRDLSTIVRLLDLSLEGSYRPEPGLLGLRDPKRASVDQSEPPQTTQGRGAMFDVEADEDEDDVSDLESDVDSPGEIPRDRGIGTTRYVRTKRDPELLSHVIASGANPNTYLQTSTIHLAKNERGVCLNAGGWEEMRNQYLPWSLDELTDEELADAWSRLESHAQSGDSDSVEVFALVSTLLWTGAAPNSVLALEVLAGPQNPAADFVFYLPAQEASPSSAEWRIRTLARPHSEPLTESVHNPGARQSEPFFALPDYGGVEGILRRHVANLGIKPQGSAGARIFARSIRDYQDLLRNHLDVSSSRFPANRLRRVTLNRIGYHLFQRVVDLSGGDLVAASLITRRDVQIARDDRFYAAPSVVSLRKIYRDAVESVRQELVALRCPLQERQVLESGTLNASVGSTICPAVGDIKRALDRLRNDIAKEPTGTSEERVADWNRQHNLYTLYCAMAIGWVVGFRAVSNPFLPPDEIDPVLGIASFQDKGPNDRSKSRLIRLPGWALAQELGYYEYLMDDSVSFGLYARFGVPHFCSPCKNGLALVEVKPSTLEPFLEDYLPLPANASRHFGRTEFIERGVAPEHVSAWLGHFFRGEEPWGKYSTYRYTKFCKFMEKELPGILCDLGFKAIDYEGIEIPAVVPEVERFRRRKVRPRTSRNEDTASAQGIPAGT